MNDDSRELEFFDKLVDMVLAHDPDPRRVKYTVPYYVDQARLKHVQGSGILLKLLQPKFLTLLVGDATKARKLAHEIVDYLFDRITTPGLAEFVYKHIKEDK